MSTCVLCSAHEVRVKKNGDQQILNKKFKRKEYIVMCCKHFYITLFHNNFFEQSKIRLYKIKYKLWFRAMPYIWVILGLFNI